jgi:hypothetical protein
VNIEDDNILLSPELLLAFMAEVRRRFPLASFSAENGLDYRMLQPRVLSRLAEGGFTHLNLSLGGAGRRSGSTRSLEDLGSVVGQASGLGLSSTVHFVCGLPTDRPQDIVRTLVALHALPSQIGISLFYPVPGLEGFEPRAMASQPPRRMCGSVAWPWAGSLTTSQMITAFRLARWSNAAKHPANRGEIELVDSCRVSRRIRSWFRERGNRVEGEVPHLDAPMMTRFFSGVSG